MAHFELENIWAARLRIVKLAVANHESRITALETSGRRRSIPWSKLIRHLKTIATVASFLYRTWPLWVTIATAAWTIVLPGLRWVWALISSGVAYLVAAGIG